MWHGQYYKGCPCRSSYVGGTLYFRKKRIRGCFFLWLRLAVLFLPEPGYCHWGFRKSFLELQEKGAANLNLVTGAHCVPHIISALELARGKGMNLPVVYNSSGYESVETIRRLDGYVDVYLPDMKYMEPELAAAFSNARDYPQAAQSAIAEMMRQTGPCQFAEDGYIKRGTIVRHLILPGHTQNSIAVLKYLYRTYGEDIFISVMNQYTPVWKNEKFPELNRKVTRREYEKVLDAAIELGIENGYFQEGETAEESFIPAFDYEGV